MVKLEWFKRYKPEDLPKDFDQIVMSCDTANKVSELSDYTALTVWGVKGKQIYLLHVLRRRMYYPELKRAVVDTAQQFDATRVPIEDKASGTPLIQDLQGESLQSVTGTEPKGDKVMRMDAQTATIENGFVYLPEAALWLDDYIKELAAFPHGKHDDQVDSTAQALGWLKRPQPGDGWFQYIKEQLAEDNRRRGFTTRVRGPVGNITVITCGGRELWVPSNRIIWVSEGEALGLINAGWTRVG